MKIRLARLGAKKKPFYRLVVADSKAKRDGSFLEIVGYYDPNPDPFTLEIDMPRLDSWLKKGALPTETVRSLIRRKKALA